MGIPISPISQSHSPGGNRASQAESDYGARHPANSPQEAHYGRSHCSRHMPAKFIVAVVALAVCLAEGRGNEAIRVHHRMPQTPQLCCGVDCLYVCLRTTGNQRLDLLTLEKGISVGARGVSIETLIDFCKKSGVSARCLRLRVAELKYVSNPLILHVSDNHFIAFLGMENGRLLLFDNGIGLFECSTDWFNDHYEWRATALVIGTPCAYLGLKENAAGVLFMGSGVIISLAALAELRGRSRKEAANVQSCGQQEGGVACTSNE